MTAFSSLLQRNAAFAHDFQSVPLAPPSAGVVIVSCLDHRLPPEHFLALADGEAPVIRNAGGRVTPAVIQDVAFLASLSANVFAADDPTSTLFEVAIIHHDTCGTGFLADESFRRLTADQTGIAESVLSASIVLDPRRSVRDDVARLLAAPEIPPRVSVSGHVYDVSTGRVTTVVEARSRVAR